MIPIHVPFEKHVLANGLRVVLHRDPKTPVVTVSVWYHVGSKNETPGRTGFAHLFEHLMFEGSEHHDGEYFRPLEAAGASVINGTTNRDRTNYFQTVPKNALDLALWLESDRMGHLLGVMSQEKLDEQREVVRNEKRQSDNQPYGRVSALLSRSLYPNAHPYSWPIIGSIEDLDAASLDDVREWFERYYRPDNAVLVLSGDLETGDAVERVERHFGDIPAGAPLERPGTWIAELTESRRVVLEDRVPQARVYRAWNVPPIYHHDHHQLSLLAKALSSGKSSRLYRRLVHDEQIATEAHAYLWSGEIGSSVVIQATCAPDAEIEVVETAIDEEVSRLSAEGPRADEVERARNRTLASFRRGLQRTGGFGGKSEVLAHGEVFRGKADAYRDSLAAIEGASAESLHSAAERWLMSGSLTLTVEPVPIRDRTTVGADRDRLPVAAEPPRPRFPRPESTRLSSGLEVRWVPWGDLALVHLSFLSDAGFAADHAAGEVDAPRGTATLTMQAIDEGTSRRSALEISDALGSMGSRLVAAAGLDTCRVALSALAEHAEESLEVLAEILRDPAFPEDELARLKREQLARIARERATPVQLALRVLPRLLYGSDHAYGMPFTGSGTEDEVRATERRHIAWFHRNWLGPERSTLLCVGNPDRDRLAGRLDELLGDWRGETGPVKALADAAPESEARIFVLDRPDSVQSILFGGQVVPPRGHPDELSLEIFNHALGGAFTSRLNLNLREDKGWTYGAHSLLWSARGQRPFLLYTSVQSDQTAASIREMDRELREMLDRRPITKEELTLAQTSLADSLPARWETLADLSASLEELITFGLPPDHWDEFGDRIRALDAETVTDDARRWLEPNRFVWVVVGDLKIVRDSIERLDMGAVELLEDR